LVTDFDVGYLYEFGVEFTNDLHLNIFFRRFEIFC